MVDAIEIFYIKVTSATVVVSVEACYVISLSCRRE
jgi:hypothetical protein